MADKISDVTPRSEILANGKSLELGETKANSTMSSKDQLLLDRIQSLEEQLWELSILHKSRTVERNSSRPQSRSRSRKRFDNKGKYCYFHFVSVLDSDPKSVVRLVHGIKIRKTSICSRNCDKFCCPSSPEQKEKERKKKKK
ncbi:hypothetical protein NPIL_398111 [Nephila pilipes]|uniref:Uncharacterized protein n=1 Tax=Nephila pilipes TaxID=299642 RepID=A0A8X6T7P5_NEPPI|nr:hypothetical protein NPIL_398111 [Nephila pilipes]